MTAIIAHRGASAYLPEHTLPAKALAYAMGADFLEQDVVATRDDELVVLHDIHLDRVTDVAARFPDRARDDGRFYVRDFDLEEIRTLRVTERVDAYGNAVYPGRFPPHIGRFGVNTLGEEIEFLRGLIHTTGGSAGIYPEIKRPAWHREEGIDLAAALLEVLAAHGYEGPDDPVYVQCFDAAEVWRLRHELGCSMRLVQLVGDNKWGEAETDYELLCTEEGLAELAQTADAIGPWVNRLYTPGTAGAPPTSSGLIERAREAGLLVHPYTFRADDLPPGFEDFDAMLRFFCVKLAVDGLFTDFPDRVRSFLTDQAMAPQEQGPQSGPGR